MKYLSFLFPLVLVAGCASTPASTFSADTGGGPPVCPWVASASGTTGQVSYSCEHLSCNNSENTFHCKFHNLTSDSQNEIGVQISLYSEASHMHQFTSDAVFSNTLGPNADDDKWISFPKSTAAACGRDLRRCVFLVEQARGLYLSK